MAPNFIENPELYDRPLFAGEAAPEGIVAEVSSASKKKDWDIKKSPGSDFATLESSQHGHEFVDISLVSKRHSRSTERVPIVHCCHDCSCSRRDVHPTSTTP